MAAYYNEGQLQLATVHISVNVVTNCRQRSSCVRYRPASQTASRRIQLALKGYVVRVKNDSNGSRRLQLLGRSAAANHQHNTCHAFRCTQPHLLAPTPDHLLTGSFGRARSAPRADLRPGPLAVQVPQGTMRLRSAGQQQSSISRTLTSQSMTNYQRTSTQSIREWGFTVAAARHSRGRRGSPTHTPSGGSATNCGIQLAADQAVTSLWHQH
jgi:hypothetical protein